MKRKFRCVIDIHNYELIKTLRPDDLTEIKIYKCKNCGKYSRDEDRKNTWFNDIMV